MFENGIRGAISGAAGDSYVKSDDNQKAKYVDQIKLYNWAMMQCLTYGDFQTLNENEITLKQKINTSDDKNWMCPQCRSQMSR